MRIWTPHRFLSKLRDAWRESPHGLQRRIYSFFRSTGIPYVLTYLATYQESHQRCNFAGNIIGLRHEYSGASPSEKSRLSSRYRSILNCIILQNGVTKTTYESRYGHVLAALQNDGRLKLNTSSIDVLDLPSSAGMASIECYDGLRQVYDLRSYVLGDLYWRLYLDEATNCVYDEDGNLLQVLRRRDFVSIYRPHRFGDVHGLIPSIVLFPLDVRSFYLCRRYPSPLSRGRLINVDLFHPAVETRLSDQRIRAMTVDVFATVPGEFDLILSLNLLQANYFGVAEIDTGISNLSRALREDGVLILGDSDVLKAWRKQHGRLIPVPTCRH